MNKIKYETPMIRARMKVAQKALNSGIQKRDEGKKEILEAKKMILGIQKDCQHPTDKLIDLEGQDAKKCSICYKIID